MGLASTGRLAESLRFALNGEAGERGERCPMKDNIGQHNLALTEPTGQSHGQKWSQICQQLRRIHETSLAAFCLPRW
jgi:hypothetical protein